jgi:hypothetical protein
MPTCKANPSVKIEGGRRLVDSTLDPFDPKNGCKPTGPSRYSRAFEDRYFAAQARRMNELIDAALSAQTRMKSGAYPYPDDDVVIIPSGGNPGAGPDGGAVLAALDPSIADLMSTALPEKLLTSSRQGTLFYFLFERTGDGVAGLSLLHFPQRYSAS